VPVDWDRATPAMIEMADLESTPAPNANFAEVPPAATKAKNYETWGKDFAGWLFRTQKLDLFKSLTLNETSKPGESERDFRIRLQQRAREERDAAAERLRQKYAPKIAALRDRIRRAEQAVAKEEEQARQSQIQAAVSIGATLLGAFLGRKTISASTIGKATTAIRGAGRVMKDSKDVGFAKENVQALQQQLTELEAEFKAETDSLATALDPQTETFETIGLRPAKSNIAIRLLSLAWTPYWIDPQGKAVMAS